MRLEMFSFRSDLSLSPENMSYIRQGFQSFGEFMVYLDCLIKYSKPGHGSTFCCEFPCKSSEYWVPYCVYRTMCFFFREDVKTWSLYSEKKLFDWETFGSLDNEAQFTSHKHIFLILMWHCLAVCVCVCVCVCHPGSSVVWQEVHGLRIRQSQLWFLPLLLSVLRRAKKKNTSPSLSFLLCKMGVLIAAPSS